MSWDMSGRSREPDRVVPILIRDFDFDEAARQWIHDELISLWGSLLHEHEYTQGNDGIARIDRPWSMACDDLADRIRSATALVGPADWNECIGMPSIINGWFVWANEKIGIKNAHLPTRDDVMRCSELWRQHSMGWR